MESYGQLWKDIEEHRRIWKTMEVYHRIEGCRGTQRNGEFGRMIHERDRQTAASRNAPSQKCSEPKRRRIK